MSRQILDRLVLNSSTSHKLKVLLCYEPPPSTCGMASLRSTGFNSTTSSLQLLVSVAVDETGVEWWSQCHPHLISWRADAKAPLTILSTRKPLLVSSTAPLMLSVCLLLTTTFPYWPISSRSSSISCIETKWLPWSVSLTEWTVMHLLGIQCVLLITTT